MLYGMNKINNKNMTKSEFTDEIQKAIDMVAEAEDVVATALRHSRQMTSHFEAYGGYGFTQLLGNGNRYDRSLYDLIDGYEELYDEEDDNS